MVLGDVLAELEELEALVKAGDQTRLARAIERYHDRRRAFAGELVHAARTASPKDDDRELLKGKGPLSLKMLGTDHVDENGSVLL